MDNSYLNYCKKCQNKGFDFQQGVICNLTEAKPDFVGLCPSYVENPDHVKTYNDSIRRYSQLEGKVDGWTRFANYFVDRIIILVLSFIMGAIIAFSGYSSISRLESYLVSFTVIILYFTIMEGVTGRTVGKFITGTIVVNEQGYKPEFSQIIGRSFCRLIPFEAFSFLGDSHSGWHDTITKTKVIKRSAYLEMNRESELLDENLY